MDIVKAPVKKSWLNRKRQLMLASLLAFFALMAYANYSLNQVSVKRQDILLGTVQHGDLAMLVDGYGQLISNKQQLITSLTGATVQEIVLKPGAVVAQGSVIVRLANPELQQQLDNAEQGLLQQQANLRQLKLNQQRELLNENATLAELQARFASAKLKREAEQKLVQSGIVSQLTYQESVLNEQQLQQRITILQQRRAQLTLVHQEAISIEQQQLKQQQGRVAVAQNRLDKLQVRADFAGVLQRLSVALGQSLAPGQEIALIGSVTDLNALVRVSQTQAGQIQLGQTALIDTRQDKISGTVVRINPMVVDNTVEIEINLPSALPHSARPQQNIDAQITTNILTNINYIERPVNIKQQGQQVLYQLDNSGNRAHRTELSFGQATGRFIEISQGAHVGDTFIISDLTNFTRHEISIN